MRFANNVPVNKDGADCVVRNLVEAHVIAGLVAAHQEVFETLHASPRSAITNSNGVVANNRETIREWKRGG